MSAPSTVRALGTLQAGALRAGYRDGSLRPVDVVEAVHDRVEAHGDPAVWIHRVDRGSALAAAAALEERWAGRPLPPLYGLPFAVKDNVDVAGLPTTAACPSLAQVAGASAPLVDLLLEAGALLVGKTNLDQFATGLTGTRSPHGTPVCPADPDRVPGGSSSGSAVAVAAGLVTFAVGTDTAGSGRVPASFTGTVGVKPSRGLVSTRGVLPACRSLDCPSVFALSVADGAAVLAVLARHDPDDPWSRPLPPVASRPRPAPAALRVAVPAPSQLAFDDDDQALAWQRALQHLAALGATAVDVDLAPFTEAGELLYGGAWVAERWAAVDDLAAAHPGAVHPVVAEVVAAGEHLSAADAFRAQHRLAVLRRRAEAVWERADVLLLPTAPGHPTLAAVAADPVGANARLGVWTTFANLLDLAVVAVPSARTAAGLPVGVQLAGPAGSDERLLGVAARWEAVAGQLAGCTGHPVLAPAADDPSANDASAGDPSVDDPRGAAPDDAPARELVTVVGAHLSGLPLNPQLRALGGRLHASVPTAAAYRLLALPGGPPQRPGLVRVTEGGASVEAETWSLPRSALGELLVTVPAPLAIGTVELADGTSTLGFVCEAAAVDGAQDVTAAGGWRRHLAAQGGAPPGS